MFYIGYNFETCFERDCEFCPSRIECIHFTPYEGYSEGEEYRTFISPLDDTSGELLKNISKKISRLRYPEREIYTLTLAWYLLGYQAKDLLTLVSRGMHPLEIEKLIFELLKDEFRVYIAELIEHGGLEADDIENIEDPNSPQWIEFLIHMRAKNFTGEVRLGPPEEEPQEEHIPPEIVRKIDEALKWASSVKYAKNGTLAYRFSQNAKNLLKQLPPDWAEVIKSKLKKAWEEWKSSHAKKK